MSFIDDYQQSGGIDLTQITPPGPRDEITQDRSKRYDFALQDRSPGVDQLYTNLAAGGEGRLREELVIEERSRQNTIKVGMVDELARRRKGPIGQDEKDFVMGLRDHPDNIDPRTYIEQEFGRQYVNVLAQQPSLAKSLEATQTANFPAALDNMDKISDQATHHAFFVKNYQDALDRWEKTGMGQAVWSYAKNMLIPFLGWAQAHKEDAGFLPGENLEREVQSWWFTPQKDLPKLQARMDELWDKNPLQAFRLASSLLDFAASRKHEDNVGALIDLSIVPQLFAGRALRAVNIPVQTLEASQLSKQAIDKLKAAMPGVEITGRIAQNMDRKVLIPRSMTPEEIYNMRVGLEKLTGTPATEAGRVLTKDELAAINVAWATKGGRVVTEPQARPFTVHEIAQMRDNLAVDTQRMAEYGPIAGYRTADDVVHRIRPSGATTAGEQPSSLKTYYVKPEDAQSLRAAAPQSRIVDHGDNRLSLTTREPQGHWAITEAGNRINASTAPKPGLVPVELQGHRKVGGYDTYGRNKVGGEITEIFHGKGTRMPTTAREFTPAEIARMDATLNVEKNALLRLMQGFKPSMDMPSILAAAGEIKAAGVATATKAVLAQNNSKSLTSQEMLNSLQGVHHFDQITAQPGSFSAAEAARIRTRGEATERVIKETLKSLPPVRSAPAETVAKAFALEADAFREQWRRLHPNDSILNVEFQKDAFGIPNANAIKITLGTPKGELFETFDRATRTAIMDYKLGPGNYRIRDDGRAIEVTRPVDMARDGVREAYITTDNSPPLSLVNIFLGPLRNADDVTSRFSTQQRKLSMTQANKIADNVKLMAAPLRELNKEEATKLRRLMASNTAYSVDGKEGTFFNTLGEYSEAYFKMFGKNPAEKEADAYFAAVAINDFEYQSQNVARFTELHNKGIMENRFRASWDGGKPVWSEYVKGKTVDELPGRTGAGYGVYIIDRNGNRYLRSSQITTGIATDITKKQKDGFKIIQLAEPNQLPLREFAREAGSDFINFVVTKNQQDRPLSLNQIPYNSGFHRIYETQTFVKQPVFGMNGGRQSYVGDRTILGQESGAAATQYTEAMNTARRLYVEKNFSALADHANKTLPFTGEEITKRFQNGTWDPLHDFHATRYGEDTWTSSRAVREGGAQNEHHSPYNLVGNSSVPFMAERDPVLRTIKNLGTEANPQYVLENARFIDPLEGLNRTATSIGRNMAMGPYKTLGIETFIQNAIEKNLLDVSAETLRTNPWYWTVHADEHWRKGADRAAIATAKAENTAVLNYLGYDGEDVSRLKQLQNLVVDGVHNTLGQRKGDWLAEHIISRERDPTTVLRSMAFHPTMGFFNYLQFINQAQTVVHSFAVAGPEHGWKGFTGASLLAITRFNQRPETIDRVADIAAKIGGWKKENFLEAYDIYNRSGWGLVGGEVAWRNDVRDQQLIPSMFGKFLDAGTFFFNEGERLSRQTAMFTAVAERQKRLPGKKIADDEIAGILSRADDMNVNMTRASGSPWQHGLASIPTQFASYQIRLMEQMLGNRLTGMEKARVFATYSAMYGVPIGATVGIGLWPAYDTIRSTALERGYDWDKTYAGQLFGEGIPSTILTAVTGKKTNLSEQFGPRGLSQIRDMLKADPEWGKVIFGVSGSKIADMGNALHPIWSGLAAAMTGNSDAYPMRVSDLVQAGGFIKSFDTATKTYMAWNAQKFITKQGRAIQDADKTDAVLMAAFGVIPREMSDLYKMADSNKATVAAQKSLEPLILKELQTHLQAAVQNDDYTAKSSMARIQWYFAAGDFSPRQQQEVFQKIREMSGDLADRIKQNFYIRQAPGSQQEQRFKTYTEPK